MYILFNLMTINFSNLIVLGNYSDIQYRNVRILLLSKAIRDASSEKGIFDFEGSMIESIATFFRKFGAEPTPYFNISKIFSMKGELSNLVKLIYHRLKE